jgi:hypothetical protein
MPAPIEPIAHDGAPLRARFAKILRAMRTGRENLRDAGQ